MTSPRPNILVIGAGIAGLAAARSLLVGSQKRARSLTVQLVESEEQVCTQASGRNAAIFRPLETDPLLVRAAAGTARILGELQRFSEAPLLNRRGFVMLDSHAAALELMAKNCADVGVESQFLSPSELRRVARLPLTHLGPALFCPEGGELSPHEIAQALLKDLRERGARLELARRADRLLFSGTGACVGVRLDDGTERRADVTILCAGAASGRLALQSGLPLPLVPLQRHLAILDAAIEMPREVPAIWSLDPEVYFRPEPGGLLISPCDETPSFGEPPQADVETLARLPRLLEHIFPQLSEAKVRHFWACIRTKAVDGRPVIGPCRHTAGLAYFAGLGGFGMSCGLGLADLLADSLLDEREQPMVNPARLQLPAAARA